MNTTVGTHIEFRGVTRYYDFGTQVLKAVDEVSFKIAHGEFVVILGPSGAGKSTLLNLMGGMDAAQQGSVTVGDTNLFGLSDNALTRFRAVNVGFIFQFYNLIPTLTALENVALTRQINRAALDAREALTQVGLADHADQFPAQLSGGEQQRVSIARAIAKNTALLLADEPTGALDTQTGHSVIELLRALSRDEGRTVVMVTHNENYAKLADRVLRMQDGKLCDIITRPCSSSGSPKVLHGTEKP
jgi:putative ABC transport system ATP-binding protein